MVGSTQALNDKHAELRVHNFKPAKEVKRSICALFLRKLFRVELRYAFEIQIPHVDQFKVGLDDFNGVGCHIGHHNHETLEDSAAEILFWRHALSRDVLLACQISLTGLRGHF
uniref:Uncharacterized protein n=1 Tax=Favella ehrenbergii TaxID=182087 RepID=A0A7S3I208_9SPIT